MIIADSMSRVATGVGVEEVSKFLSKHFINIETNHIFYSIGENTYRKILNITYVYSAYIKNTRLA